MEFGRSMAVLKWVWSRLNGEGKQSDGMLKILSLRIYKYKEQGSTRVANSRSMSFATR